MPEIQPSAPAQVAAALPAADAAGWLDDADFALGCECADPALQIERWRQEASSAPDMN